MSSPANDPRDAIEVVLSGGIYNPTKATCSLPCPSCQGFTSIDCDSSGVTEPVGGEEAIDWGYSYSTGVFYTLSESLSSSAPNVMTMTNGVATGVSPGTAQYMGTDNNQTPVYMAQFCSTTMCPTTEIGSCGGTATVIPCTLQFTPGQFTPACDGSSHSPLFSLGQLAGGSCVFGNPTSCSTGDVSGDVTLDATQPISCKLLAGVINGSLGMYAGAPGQASGTTVGSVDLTISFTLNGQQVDVPESVPVVCK